MPVAASASDYPRRNAATQRFTLGAPRTITVAADESRVAFARSLAGDDPINRLWVIDLPSGEPRMVADPVELLAADDSAADEMTDAEKARRERAREAGGGIVTYARDSNLTQALFVLSGRTFRCDLIEGAATELDTAAGAFDPRLSPDGTHVAYVAADALRTIDLAGHDDRLVIGDESADVTWGLAEFVAAEEMGRGRGYWWGPQSDRLLVARVDNSQVPIWYISAPVTPQAEPRANRYPAAGAVNATVDLAVIGLDGSRVNIDWRRGEFEYLAKAAWAPRQEITLTVQTRDQRTMAVLSVDPYTGEATEIYRDADEHWVEPVLGVPAYSGDRLVTVSDQGAARRLLVDGRSATPDDLQVHSVQSVTADHAIINATADPTEMHLYRVALDDDALAAGGRIEALTTVPGLHRAALGGKTMVTIASTTEAFGSEVVVRPDGATPFGIRSLAESPDLEVNVQFAAVGPDGLQTALLVPNGEFTAPLPVLLDPYGGPHASRVLKARGAFLASQWFADQGFAVIVCDGRGTPNRGPEWERSVRGDLATPVLEDQVTALSALSELHPGLLDLDRVAIRGWSFGGYLAALAVIRRPDVFHAAVAGAPVTDWRLYDTHYTERYLGHPDTEPDNYDRTDLCAEAADLTRPLMLIHGLADDNVVAAHTLALSRALLEAGRPHQVLPLSGVTHMTPQESVAENLLLLQLDFIRSSLGL